MSSPPWHAEFNAYLAKRDQQRADDVNALLSRFTPRERSLMRDVAVLAFVRGMLHQGAGGECPKDSGIFSDVLIAFTVQPEDAYPAVFRGATYTEQGGGPDGAASS